MIGAFALGVLVGFITGVSTENKHIKETVSMMRKWWGK